MTRNSRPSSTDHHQPSGLPSSAPLAAPRCNPPSELRSRTIDHGPRPSAPDSRTSGARIALLAAMALGGLLSVTAIGAEIPRSDERITARDGAWRTLDAKLDEPEKGFDLMLPGGVEYEGESPQRFMLLRKTFEAPKGFQFRPLTKEDPERIAQAQDKRTHHSYGPWRFCEKKLEYVDIWADLETVMDLGKTLMSVRSVIGAEDEIVGGGEDEPIVRIRVQAILSEPQTASAAYHLRCEGNLASIPRGQPGGQPITREWFWAAQVADHIVKLDSDLNKDGSIDEHDVALKVLGRTGEPKHVENATEYLFINYNMSNGLWDKDDPLRPPSHAEDDDLQEIKISGSSLFCVGRAPGLRPLTPGI